MNMQQSVSSSISCYSRARVTCDQFTKILRQNKSVVKKTNKKKFHSSQPPSANGHMTFTSADNRWCEVGCVSCDEAWDALLKEAGGRGWTVCENILPRWLEHERWLIWLFFLTDWQLQTRRFLCATEQIVAMEFVFRVLYSVYTGSVSLHALVNCNLLCL